MILTSEQEYSCLQMFLCPCSEEMWLSGPHKVSTARHCEETSLLLNKQDHLFQTALSFVNSPLQFFFNQAIFKRFLLLSLTITLSKILHVRKLSYRDHVFQMGKPKLSI